MPRCLFVAFLAGAMTTLALGSAVAQPWPLSSSSDGITMRWYGDTNDETQARAMAGAYCTATGRGVRLAAIEEDGSAVVARYHCF